MRVRAWGRKAIKPHRTLNHARGRGSWNFPRCSPHEGMPGAHSPQAMAARRAGRSLRAFSSGPPCLPLRSSLPFPSVLPAFPALPAALGRPPASSPRLPRAGRGGGRGPLRGRSLTPSAAVAPPGGGGGRARPHPERADGAGRARGGCAEAALREPRRDGGGRGGGSGAGDSGAAHRRLEGDTGLTPRWL